ncbi:hypothetical protein LCGC14_2796920 [marine sediment metagenome]|uniref:Uncharacterized protein n=1 Tax=marine sediment metagenome TaxID=412755 RepID=A0A0F9BFA2_9ZZZZ
MDEKFDPYPDDVMSKEDVKKFSNWEKQEIIVYKFMEIDKDNTFRFDQLFDNIKGNYSGIPSLDLVGIGLGVISQIIKGFDRVNFQELLNSMVRSGKIKADKAGGKIRYFID